MTYSYNDWYIKADQAWTMYHDLMDEQSELVDYNSAEVASFEELQIEMKEWREAAEYAEKMMEELEKCQSYPHSCQPAKELMFPFA